MKKKIIITVFLVFFLLFSNNLIFAQRGTAQSNFIDVRIASPLPRNSEWGRMLDRLAAEWQRITNNQVRTIVSHDGREGSESEMLRKLSGDAIQVGIFTSSGVFEICPPVMNLSVPFLIRTQNEFDIIFQEMMPILDSRVRNDFVVIAWSKGGWVYLFSKEPVFTPDDLRQMRIASSPELRDMNTVFTRMGFSIMEVDVNSVGTRLASNMVNTIYLVPTAIAPMQLHRILNHMLDIPIAPVIGAIVMNRVTWNKLSADQQREMLRVTRNMVTEFDSASARTEEAAIAAMGRDGLSINRPNQAQNQLWQQQMLSTIPQLIGEIFDRDIYNQINQTLARIRR